MILDALVDHYERLLERNDGSVPPYGYSDERIAHVLVLSADGTLLDVQDRLDPSARTPVGRPMTVPAAFKRPGTLPKPFFLWDKSSYVLGVSRDDDKRLVQMPGPHDAFRRFHEALSTDPPDEGLLALQAFLRSWTPDRFLQPPFREDMLDRNFAFRLDGAKECLHERPALRRLWSGLYRTEGAPEAMCLVTGRTGPVAVIHPSIKGVDDAQSSGASIVSFNQDAFASYGKDQGANAPVSEGAAFAYTAVLNSLLRRSADNRQRLRIGDATVVFWAATGDPSKADAAEELVSSFFDPPANDDQEAARIRSVLEQVRKGVPLESADPGLDPATTMYVLGLAPNAARLSIRYWVTDSLGTFAVRLAQHHADLALAPTPWSRPPGVWRIALATARVIQGRQDADDVPPNLAGEVVRSILTGERYPRSLLAAVVMRMRADREASGLRAAICKAVLNRDARLGVRAIEKEIPVSLDPTLQAPGYVLGRLFATLEEIQQAALGRDVNATIRDRYYGAASATPASVFPLLVRNAQHHLARLRKDKPGWAINLEKQLGQVMDLLAPALPKSLPIEAQGQFAVGYYHQSTARYQRKDEPDTDEDGATPDTND
jgi:CRISPR-associated protein Csd1